MKLNKTELLFKIGSCGCKNKKKNIIKYLKLFGVKSRIKRLKSLEIETSHEYSPNYESSCMEGLGFSWQETYIGGEWSTDVYDILNNNKIEDKEVADAIYQLLSELNF